MKVTIPSIETHKKISCFAFVKMAKAGDFLYYKRFLLSSSFH
mgnify:CR=1 FL=1